MRINPELLVDKPSHLFDGRKVKLFMSTYNKESNSCTGEIMEGESKGKWTTVYLDRATKL